LLASATGTPEEYQLGLMLAEALSNALPDNRVRRFLLAIARYRVGHYTEALTLLGGWQHERKQMIISQVGQYLMAGWPVALLGRQPVRQDIGDALALSAMTYHRLGHPERARAILADLRTLRVLDDKSVARLWKSGTYPGLLREAESVIEGGPKPGK
jgi:hypothetical protein